MVSPSTQDFLKIKEVRDGFIILKNNSLRGVMMVSSINFGLKTQNSQEAIIYQFQQFLNSIDFSIQILVQTRKLNITGYLEKLKDLEKKQENELLKTQTTEYRNFIGKIVEGGTIMTKNFYIVVPYSLMEERTTTRKKLKKVIISDLSKQDLQRCKDQLWQRMEFLGLGLRGCGLNAIPLTSPELIELFWSTYHPQQAEIGYYPEIPPEMSQI
jgi:hypothetical protein